MKVFTGALGICAFAIGANASAQSFVPGERYSNNETRVEAAVTIPLGRSIDRRQTYPRFEIVSRSRSRDTLLHKGPHDQKQDWTERKFGITLNGEATVFLNGRPMEDPEGKAGISTAGTIAIGLGVVLIVGAVTLADSVDSIEDLTDPD